MRPFEYPFTVHPSCVQMLVNARYVPPRLMTVKSARRAPLESASTWWPLTVVRAGISANCSVTTPLANVTLPVGGGSTTPPLGPAGSPPHPGRNKPPMSDAPVAPMKPRRLTAGAVNSLGVVPGNSGIDGTMKTLEDERPANADRREFEFIPAPCEYLKRTCWIRLNESSQPTAVIRERQIARARFAPTAGAAQRGGSSNFLRSPECQRLQNAALRNVWRDRDGPRQLGQGPVFAQRRQPGYPLDVTCSR